MCFVERLLQIACLLCRAPPPVLMKQVCIVFIVPPTEMPSVDLSGGFLQNT